MCIDDCSAKWKEPYIAAVLEIDSEKILSRIHDAKMAICDRVEELNGRGDISERVALHRAMRALCELQDIYCGDSQNLLRQARERFRAAANSRARDADQKFWTSISRAFGMPWGSVCELLSGFPLLSTKNF